MPDNVIRNVLSWKVDTQSVQQAAASTKQLGDITVAQAKRTADEFTEARRITAQYDDTLGALGPTASSSLRVLETSMRNGAEETERLKRTTREAADEYDNLARSAQRAVSQTSRTSGGGGRLDSIDRAGSVGSQILGGLGAGEAANVSGLIGDVASSFVSLNPIMLATVAGGAALTLGLQAVRDAEIKAAEGAKQFFDAIDRTAGSTTADIQAQITAAQDRQASEQAAVDRLVEFRAELDRFNSAVRDGDIPVESYSRAVFGLNERIFDATGGTLGFKDGVGTFIQQTTAFGAAIEEGEKRVTAAGTEVAFLNLQLDSTAVKAADLREAEKLLADERQRIIDANTQLEQQRTQQQLADFQLLLAADNMTAEQRQARINQMQFEQDAIRAQLATGELTQGAADELRLRFAELTGQIEILEGVTKSTADTTAMAAEKQKALEDATKAAADALEARNDQYLDAVDREVDAREKALEIQTKISDLAAERDAKLLELQEGYDDRREEIAADGEERRLEAAEDAAKKLADIEEKAGDARNEAVGNRDADAFRLANKSAKEAAEDVKENLDKQNETTAKAQAKQLATLEKGYDRQVQSTVNAANRQITVQQRLVDAQLTLAAQAASNQQFLASNGALSVINIHGQMWSSLQGQAFVQGQNTVQSFANGVQSALGGAAGGGPNSFPTLSSSYGAYQPMTTARVEEIATKQYLKIKTAARGGRIVVP